MEPKDSGNAAQCVADEPIVAKPKALVGRPSGYRSEMAEQARKLCLLGARDVDLAQFFGVSLSTLLNWKGAHREFLSALKVGKEEADSHVERSLFQRATGYSHLATKIQSVKGEVVCTEYVQHYAPDTVACIFWLKNRKPAEWRDQKETVKRTENLSEEQSREMAAAMITSARRAAEQV